MLLSAPSASAEDNNPFPWADERFASAATRLSHFTSTENGGFFPWNHVLLLFPSFIHSFGFAIRLQTSTETNYPLALATCRTHFHLGKTKKQQVQLESIIISDDKASSPISNSAVLSQHLRRGKYASRCLLRGHRWSLVIISFWTQWNIFYTNPRVREIIPGRTREIPNNGCQSGAE